MTMLPLAHIYVATQVARRKPSLLVLGSILPDIAWTSTDEVGRDKIHNAPQKFYDFIKNIYPELTDLALGAKLHSNIDKGADYYSDGENYTGFAFTEGKAVESGVVEMIGEQSVKSLLLSHNFIEAGVDLNLLETKPEILALYKVSADNLDWNAVYASLASYLGADTQEISDAIKSFLAFVGPDSYKSQEILVQKMTQYIKVRKKINADIQSVGHILEQAKNIMRNKHEKYLDNAIDNMRADFAGVI